MSKNERARFEDRQQERRTPIRYTRPLAPPERSRHSVDQLTHFFICDLLSAGMTPGRIRANTGIDLASLRTITASWQAATHKSRTAP